MIKLRATIKMVLFALCVLIVIPIQSIILFFTHGRVSYIVPRVWHALVSRIFRIKIKMTGVPAINGQVIYMSNHISYLDIPALGGILTASFVAKREVEGWALFGFLSKLQQTAFIQRDRGAAKTVQAMLDKMLDDGKNLILFPEGTSTDGKDVRPFKSSLFSLVLNSEVPELAVQPVTIKLLSANGQAVTLDSVQALRDIYSWHVEMDESIELHHHLWAFAKSRGAEIEVIFHEPLWAKDFDDRKIMAKACHDQVKGGLLLDPVA